MGTAVVDSDEEEGVGAKGDETMDRVQEKVCGGVFVGGWVGGQVCVCVESMGSCVHVKLCSMFVAVLVDVCMISVYSNPS